MNTTNVLHVIHRMNGFGGIQQRLIELVCKPMPGFKAHVFSINSFSPYYIQILNQSKIPFRSPSQKTDWENVLVDFALESKIEIVHFHIPATKEKILLKKVGIKIIIDNDHGQLAYLTPAKINVLKEYMNLTDGVIAASEASRLQLIKRFGYSPTKVVKIYDGFDFEKLTTKEKKIPSSKRKVISTVCRLVEDKGIYTFIKSIPYILEKNKNIIFWVIGDGPLFTKLTQKATKYKINKYIKFWRNRKNIVSLLKASDLFVLPTVADALAGVLVEAGYLGKTCITTNIDGNPEIILNGQTGILLKPTIPWKKPLPYLVVDGATKNFMRPKSLDSKVLAKTIVKLLKDPKSCNKMGHLAHKRIFETFNIDKSLTELMNFYRLCLTRYSQK